MTDLAKIIGDELFRQCTHGKGALVIERLPIADRDDGDDGFRFFGKIDIPALSAAMITAIREPTKEMVVAGDDAKESCIDSDWDSGPDGEGHNSYTTVNSDLPAIVFRAMIDALIKEQK